MGETQAASLPPYVLAGAINRHDHHRGDEDYYSQARDLFRLMSADQRALRGVAG